MPSPKERVLGIGGIAALIVSVGWMDLAGCFGCQISPALDEVVVAESQCDAAEAQIDPETERLTCIADTTWIKRFAKTCAAREENQLAWVNDGKLLFIGTCNKAASEVAKGKTVGEISQGRSVDSILEQLNP